MTEIIPNPLIPDRRR